MEVDGRAATSFANQFRLEGSRGRRGKLRILVGSVGLLNPICPDIKIGSRNLESILTFQSSRSHAHTTEVKAIQCTLNPPSLRLVCSQMALLAPPYPSNSHSPPWLGPDIPLLPPSPASWRVSPVPWSAPPAAGLTNGPTTRTCQLTCGTKLILESLGSKYLLNLVYDSGVFVFQLSTDTAREDYPVEGPSAHATSTLITQADLS